MERFTNKHFDIKVTRQYIVTFLLKNITPLMTYRLNQKEHYNIVLRINHVCCIYEEFVPLFARKKDMTMQIKSKNSILLIENILLVQHNTCGCLFHTRGVIS